LRDHLNPTFGAAPLAAITPAAVKVWHAGLSTGPTARAQAYGLLRTILGTAVDEDALSANPCRVRGAGQTKRSREVRPATLSELEAVVRELPERYRLMALMAAWCALRFGELTELRRSDIDLKAGTVRVARGVVRTRGGGMTVKGPKSDAGKRVVTIPPHLVPLVREHLAACVTGRDGLLFPSATDPTEHMMNSTMSKVWLAARERAGVPHLRFHDLRHTGAVLAAQTGATLAELMARLGHSTPQAAMRYQHASADRDRVIAEALSRLATN
jgi:integrase